MADFGTPEQMAASMPQMQQQIQQMQELQQTIAAQKLAAQREPPVPIGTIDAAAETETSEEDKQEGEQPPLEDVHDDDHELEHPTAAEPVAPTTQEQLVPTRVYIPKVPYPVPAKKSRKDCEEMKCKKMLEELNVKISLMDAIQMIPSMRRMIEEILADDPLEVALI
ncbi:hypothetical protein DY000_02040570 [Brassica cretica]|uniref:Uncharacterized protein n=1 Tax=Brassica cretica TaxID=69181 RepID=A0ABQ7BHY5_BRACR|nr:hypothetical protein DY000_02040570 [Brassica cretica]